MHKPALGESPIGWWLTRQGWRWRYASGSSLSTTTLWRCPWAADWHRFDKNIELNGVSDRVQEIAIRHLKGLLGTTHSMRERGTAQLAFGCARLGCAHEDTEGRTIQGISFVTKEQLVVA